MGWFIKVSDHWLSFALSLSKGDNKKPTIILLRLRQAQADNISQDSGCSRSSAFLFLLINKKEMSDSEIINFQRIEEAIGFITENFKAQPGLDEVAKKIHLSPYHFQRLFTDWAGVSPKKFLQFISLEHAKNIL